MQSHVKCMNIVKDSQCSGISGEEAVVSGGCFWLLANTSNQLEEPAECVNRVC
jgi:hypothetical protein